jgi:peptidoglycan/LPS O-acetylase OafA/YrhL
VPNPSSPVAQRATRRISWDVIRVVALLSVVLGHVTHQSRLLHPELAGYPFSLTAQYGAATLLVVSAYFVCVSLRKGSPARWLWKKIARLLPAYLVVVLVTYVVARFAGAIFSGQHYAGGLPGFLFGPPTGGPTTAAPWYLPTGVDLFANLTMIQSWSTDFNYLDGSYWTLPVQFMAFTAAALLWPRRWRTDAGVIALIWALLIVPLVLRFVVFQPTDTPEWATTLIFGLGLHRVHAFAIGVAIWLWGQRRLSTWQLGLLVVATVAAQDLHTYPLHHATAIDPERAPSTTGFAVMLLAICVAAGGPDWNLPGLRRLAPAIRWLAGISYGVYLLHQELGYILARALLAAGASGWERLLLVLVAAVLGGWLLTEFVERPVHRRLTVWRARNRELARPRPALSAEMNAAPEDLVDHPSSCSSQISVGGAL